MYNAEIKNLEKLKEIIQKFIKESDKYNQSIGNEQNSVLKLCTADIDLEKLEQITREFVNDSGSISEEEVLKHQECLTTLPGESQLVKNLGKLEKSISGFIQFVNGDNQLVHDRQHPGSFQSREKDFMVLAKIAHELSHEKEELPSTKVQDMSYIKMMVRGVSNFFSRP